MEVIHLADNHRSSPQVVAAATAGLGPTATPPPTSATPDGPLAVVTAYEDETAEAEGVVSLIVQRSDDGVPWSDQAVLARTHDQLQVVSRALSRAGIPHRMAPGPEAPAAGGSDGGDGSDGAGGAVELATFHRAKGLEWTSVHVVGLEEGFVPIVYAEGDEALDEERRLLYVALSRASTDLHCSWARGRQLSTGRRMERQPSPWLADVAQVSRTGSARDGSAHTTQSDAVRRIAEIRASLER
jgi:superfamily I DNA/RNA helicase